MKKPGTDMINDLEFLNGKKLYFLLVNDFYAKSANRYFAFPFFYFIHRHSFTHETGSEVENYFSLFFFETCFHY